MIVVAGYTNRDDVTVARYRSDGQLDDTFGTAGVVTGIAIGIADDVTIQPEGEIVVSGSSLNPGSSGVGIDHHTGLARYLPDGHPDPASGAGGTLTLDASSAPTSPSSPRAGSCSSARRTPRRRAHRRAASPSCR